MTVELGLLHNDNFIYYYNFVLHNYCHVFKFKNTVTNKTDRKITKNIFKNERVCRDIYRNRKITGTKWLWQQNEILLPHNNRT